MSLLDLLAGAFGAPQQQAQISQAPTQDPTGQDAALVNQTVAPQPTQLSGIDVSPARSATQAPQQQRLGS